MRRIAWFLVVGALFAFVTGNAAAVVTDLYLIQSGLGGINEGDEVTVENVVVTASGLQGIFVQHPDEHPTYGRMYSGIFVFTHGTHLGDVRMGDLVNVTGHYKEYFGLSEIDCNIEEAPCGTTIDCVIEVIGTEIVPDPVLLNIADICTGGPNGEFYESVLVEVEDGDTSLFASQPDANDNWKLYTDAVGVGDSIYVKLRSADPEGEFSYTLPNEGDVFTSVAGVLIYDWNEFRIAPRSCLMDLGHACPPVLSGCWATSNNTVDVLFALDVDETSAETTDNYDFDSGLAVLAAERDDANHSIVHLTTGPMTPGYIETAYVFDVISEGEHVVMPEGEFTFAQGITPLYDIQYVDDNVSDESEYYDYVVTVTGRVSHHYGNYYYLQEGDAGPYKHLYVRITRLGDIADGDSVVVAGRVDEYYGGTYLTYTPGVQYWKNCGPAADPVIITDVPATELVYSSPVGGSLPDDNRGEPWEDALVHLIEPACVDSVNGSAALYGEWWMLTDADSIRADFSEDRNNFGADITYEPAVGDTLDISGIFMLVYNNYSLMPRSQSDITVIHSNSGAVGDNFLGRARMMLSNTPNPFGRKTDISFHLGHGARDVDIVIFDLTGAVVRNLVSDQMLPAGDHNFSWNGLDNHGNPTGSGTYFYRLSADEQTQARQMIMLR